DAVDGHVEALARRARGDRGHEADGRVGDHRLLRAARYMARRAAQRREDRLVARLCATALLTCAAGSALLPAQTIYLPTPDQVVAEMLRIARVGPGDVVYDLGSGDGRIPIAAVRDFGA